ncbi:hypothetical protein GOV11_04865 [Candidatus Woesearchaeota archaeon]|nr:hypothetical protein [Candidatus Woesearchaeota archaeon]
MNDYYLFIKDDHLYWSKIDVPIKDNQDEYELRVFRRFGESATLVAACPETQLEDAILDACILHYAKPGRHIPEEYIPELPEGYIPIEYVGPLDNLLDDDITQ